MAVSNHAAVEHGDDPVSLGRDVELMRHDHEREPLLVVEVLEQSHDLLTGRAVQITGGLIRQHDARLLDEGPGYAHPLLLTPR